MTRDSLSGPRHTVWSSLAFLAYAALLTTLLVGLQPPETAIPVSDSVLHAAAFAILGWLLYRVFPAPASPRAAWSMLLAGALSVAAYGALSEWVQGFVGRDMSAADAAADAAGALLAAAYQAVEWRKILFWGRIR